MDRIGGPQAGGDAPLHARDRRFQPSFVYRRQHQIAYPLSQTISRRPPGRARRSAECRTDHHRLSLCERLSRSGHPRRIDPASGGCGNDPDQYSCARRYRRRHLSRRSARCGASGSVQSALGDGKGGTHHLAGEPSRTDRNVFRRCTRCACSRYRRAGAGRPAKRCVIITDHAGGRGRVFAAEADV